jgi:hypothetical protein
MNVRIFLLVGKEKQDVTNRCSWVNEEDGVALLFEHDLGKPFIGPDGEVATEKVYGKFVVELRENASDAVRAIYDEMRATGTQDVRYLPSWQPKTENLKEA